MANTRRTTAALLLCGATLATAACSGRPPVDAPSPGTVRLGDGANGSTVRVALGATVVLTLGSTYWSAPQSSVPGILSSTAAPSVSADHACMAGMGCGTVQSDLRATAPGTTRLSATRVSCGEARPCPPDQRRFTITVVVGH
ncbi:hypothetical protein [Streptacidiphilus albus]|jgi:hypothetical protein|uniref:hypothetical protein n=1 Tax=Streptacidiphilus albus TaxID=105425 RepID=UPI00054BCD9C|nr:hypothetical protein [Streptacidiphilus albus]